jgi:hypothetical protein
VSVLEASVAMFGEWVVSINPTLADRGRRVSLRVSGQPPMLGVLCDAEWGRPFSFVHYDGERFPVATDLDYLEWADERLL